MAPAFVTGVALPRSGLSSGVSTVSQAPARAPCVAAPGRSEIVASKNAQLKAAKKANRRRPKKHRPSDINRAAPSVDPTPLLADGLPPAYSILEPDAPDDTVLVTADDIAAFNKAAEEEAAAAFAEADAKAAAAKVQSKADKLKAKEAKRKAHQDHKAAREAAIAAFAEAAAAAEAAEVAEAAAGEEAEEGEADAGAGDAQVEAEGAEAGDAQVEAEDAA